MEVQRVTAEKTAGSSAAAQSEEQIDALKTQIQQLQEGQAAIQRELETIKELLQQGVRARRQPTQFQPTQINISDAAVMGNAGALVTLVEFTDYQCPYCKRHFDETRPTILKDYIETGKLRYATKEIPITAKHPLASKAAEAALCAGDQGNYWSMHEMLFKNQDKLEPQQLKTHALNLGLDPEKFAVRSPGHTNIFSRFN